MRWIILVVTATAGFRHDSIETGEQVLAQLAAARNVQIVYARTEDEMRVRMTDEALRRVKAVLFVNTTGELPDESRDALLRWIALGGTFAGVHSASDTWHSSAAYLDMLGGEFVSHPAEDVAVIDVIDATHPATAHLESPHAMVEEIYTFGRFDPARVHLLLATNGQPLAWEKTFGAGRVLYTALGHRNDVWESSWFAAHIGGILDWAIADPDGAKRRRASRH